MDYTIKIGGEAGQGIQTIGDVLAQIFTHVGYHVFIYQDYESRIRGGHNFVQLRFSNTPITALKKGVDLLVCLNKESFYRHFNELTDWGQILYDSLMVKEKFEYPNVLDIPLQELALKEGGNKLMVNVVAVGAILGMFGIDPNPMYEVLRKTFYKKGKEVVENNIRSAKAGYSFAKENCLTCSFKLSEYTEPKFLISGNEAIGLGALASGVQFFSAYPMTPSTGIFNFLAEHSKEFEILVEQAEDEISAINMIIGASFAGVRSMTATSGGGFALMVEGISLAGMTETPVVIVLAQRPGPATGLPTRTEAGDLLFSIFAGHGEFPKVVFAPGSPEQAMFLVNKAFDLAEKYQIPAIILSDQYLADSQWTYKDLDISRLKNINYRLRGEEFRKLKEYKRHQFTETGISPFGIPGDTTHLVVTDSDEHDEEGHLIEDVETRIQMVQKRWHKKIPLLKKEISPPSFYGIEKPDILLLCWGSMFGILYETAKYLSRDHKVALLHFSEIYPFSHDENWKRHFEDAKVIINIEQNATSQFAKLLMMEAGLRPHYHVNKYDGRPFTVDELEDKIRAYL
ncbi:MAG: 2-oxoacid:acceptor oxidoreductase subunit alpha [Caldimicrobium sp.]|nr:2-oxoacid:acceptor oxidoreductase subunit alpha [Caldimicrobium sp.]MCX7612742.1 2-oxoacid:acceptor oxidoreductase subunit alpha [Caldimicrobium sp.]